MEDIIQILMEIRDDIDFSTEKDLVTNGIFESFEILMCMTACEEKFGVEFPPEAIAPENFESAEALWNLICKLKNAS